MQLLVIDPTTIRGPRNAAPGSRDWSALPACPRYPNLTVTYATEDGAPFFLGTNPTRTLVLNGRPLRRPALESDTFNDADFWGWLRLRKTVARSLPLPLIRPGEYVCTDR